MDDKKICFIWSINDEELFQESLLYVQSLNIPEGYVIESIEIRESNYMAKGYNEAMNSSDAKYKVYMHQDVYIINKNFIYDILRIFENEEVGLIGVIGSENIPTSGVWWESKALYGKVYDSHTGKMDLLQFQNFNSSFKSVKCVDGLIMITQYDITWREDIFTGWHFYDLSQSMEFVKNGYKVVIPRQEESWCIHDCGIVNTRNGYEFYRNIFLNDYLFETSNNDNKTKKLSFVTLLPGVSDVHLTKDVGMIPYTMQKNFGYDAYIACYDAETLTSQESQLDGLKLDFIEPCSGSNDGNGYTFNQEIDGYAYLIKNSKKIDVLQLYHLVGRTFKWIELYKYLNPSGKIYLKLDADNGIKNVKISDYMKNILQICDLISVETIDLYNYLNNELGINVAYIPNGFYDAEGKTDIKYEEKENVICTVGRIGTTQKATEILMEAFLTVMDRLPEWKLKIVGPVEESFFSYIENYLKLNPDARHRVIFTGEINDKKDLKAEYLRSKIFCLPSRWESFGIALVEAISNGCYVIGTNIASVWDITKNKEYGDIFEIDDVNGLANSLLKACNDEDKLRKVCKEVQEFAYNRFNWTNICAKIDRLL